MKNKMLAWVDKESNPEKPRYRLNEKDAMNDDLAKRKHGQRVWITIENYYRKRTVSQNNVLHWYLQEIADETGHEPDWLKEFFAKKYLTVNLVDNDQEIQVDLETGEILTRVRSTTELNTVEFNEYTEKIRMYANEFFNLQLPLPNEEKELKFTNH